MEEELWFDPPVTLPFICVAVETFYVYFKAEASLATRHAGNCSRLLLRIHPNQKEEHNNTRHAWRARLAPPLRVLVEIASSGSFSLHCCWRFVAITGLRWHRAVDSCPEAARGRVPLGGTSAPSPSRPESTPGRPGPAGLPPSSPFRRPSGPGAPQARPRSAAGEAVTGQARPFLPSSCQGEAARKMSP